MSQHDNITELYYRIGFGMCISVESRHASGLCLSRGLGCDYTSTVTLRPTKHKDSIPSKINALHAHSQIHSSMRIGSVMMLGLSPLISVFTYSLGGAIELKTTNNYPITKQSRLLHVWCMVKIAMGGFLVGVSVKTPPMLTKTQKLFNYSGN